MSDSESFHDFFRVSGGEVDDDTMTRHCFTLQIRPELLDEYVAAHAAVWPDMLAEIAAAGRRNYSLFLADGGKLIGYYETDDDAAAQRYLAASPTAARWEATMGRYFVGLDGRPDQASTPLREIFHLEDQLAQTAATAPASASTTTSPTPSSSISSASRIASTDQESTAS